MIKKTVAGFKKSLRFETGLLIQPLIGKAKDTLEKSKGRKT
ncbi:hypothetical protein D3OALGA1CA_5739 [Olavius algarvensis associated proteobacterium Delta 3]|nr:hypothetical protein D3OALGA1CA_5739 [Olavius algarvensis associated proteobacterium Delta 3]